MAHRLQAGVLQMLYSVPGSRALSLHILPAKTLGQDHISEVEITLARIVCDGFDHFHNGQHGARGHDEAIIVVEENVVFAL